MRKIFVIVLLVAVAALSSCSSGVDCTFRGSEWGFAPNTTYTATWQDPTSTYNTQSEVTSDAQGDIRISGDGPANCSEFGFSRCYKPQLADADCTEDTMVDSVLYSTDAGMIIDSVFY